MKFLLTLILLISTSVAFAQEEGYIKGIVLDQEMDNEPLAFAHISIKGHDTTMRTELDGSYNMQVKPGTYSIEFSFTGYTKKIITDIIVKDGKTTTINDITLGALQFDKAQLSKITEKESAQKVSVASLLFK